MITRVLFFVLFSVFCLNAPITAFAAPQAPKTVTLFPQRAKLFCEETMPLRSLSDGRKGIMITLPAAADPQSLRLTLNQGNVADMTWEEATRTNQQAVKSLREELAALKQEHAVVAGQLQATEARIMFWSSPSDSKATASEMERIDAAMEKHLAKLHANSYQYATREKALADAIKDLEEALNRATGASKKVWNVAIALSGSSSGDVRVQYNYMLNGCGWQPAYRFDALPAQGKISFGYDAVVHQSSGMDWNKTAITLATVERGIALTPPRLPLWIIHEREPVMMMEAMSDAAPQQLMRKSNAGYAAAKAPQRVQQGTYMAWELSKKTIPAGRRITLPIVNENWTVDFRYTARPSRDAKAYLTAKVNLPESRQLPNGRALFFVDGALIGKRGFAFSGKKGTLFFGSDPLVTATMKLLEKQSGEQGILGRKQSRTWTWDIDCQNSRNHPITLFVEEPTPQAEHEDISIEIDSTPAPKKTDSTMLEWKLTLDAHAQTNIRHRVVVEAPRDMEVEFGRHRK